MKYGVRKPSIKMSIKARTTGRIKRTVKKSVNPLYGKSGVGLVNNPKKAIYNKVYNKTTVGVADIARAAASPAQSSNAPTSPTAPTVKKPGSASKFWMIFLIIFGAIGIPAGAYGVSVICAVIALIIYLKRKDVTK